MAMRGGGLLRRFLSTSPFVSLNPPSPSPSAAPSTSLFVSGLNKRTTSEKLRESFAKFGEVVHARVITDRVNGFSKGYGFVTYSTLEEAENGIKGMDGQFLEGWVIFAEYARPKSPPPEPSPSSESYQRTQY
eukprot:TRINITY_DN23071_c0_g1_i1.p1 TRINITY_DN23071_c0_g1~~TRINITY_DN23071_c0_g1_i1.p1  ORF type:complete len:132 (+),score=18.23 TRINITY_DN23071_c0_g1_i1:57-452(+)